MPFRHALKLPPQLLGILIVVAVAGCTPTQSPRPVPSVAQIGGDLNCSAGDHGYEDIQAGWGFCYPGTWRYSERSQASDKPPGLDLTFDITDAPCTTPPPGGKPSCSPNAGVFAFMVISTYERGSSQDLSSWVQANLPQGETVGDSISWGNAQQAAKLSDGKRIALTPHHVVILDLRPGLLDLEAAMSSRLNTWKFSY